MALAVTGPRGLPAVPAALDGIPAEHVVRFSVTPTAVPAQVQATSDDTRRLGIRVLALDRT